MAASSRLLTERVERLTFISTVSVYADASQPGIDEDASLATMTGAGGYADYGALKVLCEEAVHAALPGRALIIRPGIVAGPHDHSNRFTWWVARCARGGRVPAPAPPERPLQLIDARDLAAFILDLTAAGATGTYNAVGEDLTWADLLAACCGIGPAPSRCGCPKPSCWPPGSTKRSFRCGSPTSDPDSVGFMRIDATRARAAGLRHRSLEQTARDTHAALHPEDGPGLEPALEARLIGA